MIDFYYDMKTRKYVVEDTYMHVFYFFYDDELWINLGNNDVGLSNVLMSELYYNYLTQPTRYVLKEYKTGVDMSTRNVK